MCGIIGFHATRGSLGPWFAQAARRAVHRGPDGDGAWRPGWEAARRLSALEAMPEEACPVALGHLRLSILDLSPAGSQPMIATGQAVVVLNGEIYNYLEIRRELEALGRRFHTSSDTEVLLQAYLEWGEGVLPRLNGMWAFAIYDMRRHALLLSRDRFGEKPLFLVPWRGGLAFASEVKQLAALPEAYLNLDVRSAARYLATGHPYDGPSSWFAGIRQLPPGSFLWVDDNGSREGRYHDLRADVAAVAPERDPEAWAGRFEEAFRRSVAIRLRSDVPVGSCLSAGLDSAAILSTAMQTPHHGDYHSFTLGSDDPLIDERPGARALAESVGSTWHGIIADGSDFSGIWDRMTWHMEAPVAGTSLYGQWKVMEAARRQGVVVLEDGQGADEILGGYHKFFVAAVLRLLRTRPLEGVRMGFHLMRHLGVSPRLLKYGYRYARKLYRAPHPGEWLRPGLFSGSTTPSLGDEGLEMRIKDIERWSLPNLLSYEDRNAMAHSVETRLPYLDPEVVALSLAMPLEATHHGGWSKWPVRRLLDRAGAPEVAWRRGKRGFSVPQDPWLDGALRGQVEAFLGSPHPLLDDVIDREAMQPFLDLWRRGSQRHAVRDVLFQLVALDRFFHVWFPR
jgi:asparagine synthase (glutamine-hydrolysing)